MEHETTRMRTTTARTDVAATDWVALRTISTYGCPVGELVAAWMSPRQNMRVTGKTMSGRKRIRDENTYQRR